MKLRCATHGKSEWKFTMVCSACGTVYQAVREGTEFEPICPGAVRAPEVCVCGSTLAGKKGSALAICTECFLKRVGS